MNDLYVCDIYKDPIPLKPNSVLAYVYIGVELIAIMLVETISYYYILFVRGPWCITPHSIIFLVVNFLMHQMF